MTLRLHNPARGGHWRIPGDEFKVAQSTFQWLSFALLTGEQMDMFGEWAETRPNVVWVYDKDTVKAEAMRDLIRNAQTEAANAGTFVGSGAFEGSFETPALDRLVEVISTSDALFYLDARDTPAPR